jgi:hypothetical protein
MKPLPCDDHGILDENHGHREYGQVITMEQTYWNFQETPCIQGTAVVADAPEFPQYWARDLIGQRIAVVQVGGQLVEGGPGTPQRYLDDRNGCGWEKVTYGRGGPAAPHADLSIVPGSFRPSTGAAGG